jgi:hypothetical protein
MKTLYKSQIGREDLFWLQDAKTKTWILGQQQYFKNGSPKATWKERLFIPPPPEDITEENLLSVFSQAENDLIFHDAGGEKNPTVYNKSLRKHLDDFAEA